MYIEYWEKIRLLLFHDNTIIIMIIMIIITIIIEQFKIVC